MMIAPLPTGLVGITCNFVGRGLDGNVDDMTAELLRLDDIKIWINQVKSSRRFSDLNKRGNVI
jgi:hypothetical protein